jgi:hypothetical protein
MVAEAGLWRCREGPKLDKRRKLLIVNGLKAKSVFTPPIMSDLLTIRDRERRGRRRFDRPILEYIHAVGFVAQEALYQMFT